MSQQSTYLGLDGGGTQTRWALADAEGRCLAEGAVAGISGLQLGSAGGRDALAATVDVLAAAVATAAGNGVYGAPLRIVAGLTGFALDDSSHLQALFARPFALLPSAVHCMTDIELVCRAEFAPGQGMVVYAGTGSIAAHIDAAGQMHRAGGRGAVIDDAGGGHWIATQALRHVWRLEDAAPGSAGCTPLGRELFQVLGGSGWPHTRQWVYQGPGVSRGDMGALALAVAAAAQAGDAHALALLQQAGAELARLALCLQQRLGALPLALAGRVFELHAAVETGLRQQLPPGTPVRRSPGQMQRAAARLAATQFTP